MTPLHHVAQTECTSPDMVNLLANAGAKVGAIDAIGRTPLHIAATERRLKHVLVLLSHIPHWAGIFQNRTLASHRI
jgi:ankyrin repeat protein